MIEKYDVYSKVKNNHLEKLSNLPMTIVIFFLTDLVLDAVSPEKNSLLRLYNLNIKFNFMEK